MLWRLAMKSALMAGGLATAASGVAASGAPAFATVLGASTSCGATQESWGNGQATAKYTGTIYFVRDTLRWFGPALEVDRLAGGGINVTITQGGTVRSSAPSAAVSYNGYGTMLWSNEYGERFALTAGQCDTDGHVTHATASLALHNGDYNSNHNGITR